MKKEITTIPLEVKRTVTKNGSIIYYPTGQSQRISNIGFVAQGKTDEEAVKNFWKMMEIGKKFNEERYMNMRRWVPIELGNWKKIGGKWITIFGLHFSFRYGKGMKGGKYIPYTNLNISFTNYWKLFNNYLKENNK